MIYVALARFSHGLFLKKEDEGQKQLHLYMSVAIDILVDDACGQECHRESYGLCKELHRYELGKEALDVECFACCRHNLFYFN